MVWIIFTNALNVLNISAKEKHRHTIQNADIGTYFQIGKYVPPNKPAAVATLETEPQEKCPTVAPPVTPLSHLQK